MTEPTASSAALAARYPEVAQFAALMLDELAVCGVRPFQRCRSLTRGKVTDTHQARVRGEWPMTPDWRYMTTLRGSTMPDPDAVTAARCCNPECDRPGTVYVGDLTTLGDWACSLCEVYIVGDGNDD